MPTEIPASLVASISALRAELFLLVAGVCLLLARPGRGSVHLWSFLALAMALAWTTTQWGEPSAYFHEAYFVAPHTSYFKALILAATAIAVVMIAGDPRIRVHYPETIALLLFSAAGGLLLVSSRHIAVLFLAFEILSISGYALAGSIPRSAKSTEGGLKFAIFGGAASAMLLYGLSLIYGATGSLYLTPISADFLAEPAGLLATLLVFAGVAYKLAAAPFHYWSPDAFEGAATSISGFLSVVPKIAGFALALHAAAVFQQADGFRELLVAAAVLSMIWGNLAAIAQQNVVRLLAYSSIAHAGFILAGASTGTLKGSYAVMFYLAVYLCMNLGAFYVTAQVAPTGNIREFRGLSRRHPFAALSMAVFLFSLVGLPPFGGFIAKLLILAAIVDAKAWVLVATLVATTVVSLFYYSGILREIYLEESAEPEIRLSRPVLAALDLLALLLLGSGIYWVPLARIVATAAGGRFIF